MRSVEMEPLMMGKIVIQETGKLKETDVPQAVCMKEPVPVRRAFQQIAVEMVALLKRARSAMAMKDVPADVFGQVRPIPIQARRFVVTVRKELARSAMRFVRIVFPSATTVSHKFLPGHQKK